MNALNQYQRVDRQTSIVDADRHRLVQLLYAGVLERIVMAKGQIMAGRFENKNRLINKAIEIVGGLREFLDREKGGEIADQLDGLYADVERRLFHANAHNDIEALDEVSRLIKEIKSGWDEIREEVLEKNLV